MHVILSLYIPTIIWFLILGNTVSKVWNQLFSKYFSMKFHLWLFKNPMPMKWHLADNDNHYNQHRGNTIPAKWVLTLSSFQMAHEISTITIPSLATCLRSPVSRMEECWCECRHAHLLTFTLFPHHCPFQLSYLQCCIRHPDLGKTALILMLKQKHQSPFLS